jgi:fluoride exporter
MERVLLVALGGALGSVMRYLTTLLAARWLGSDFPWGTLAVNVVGSFLIGVVYELGSDALKVSPEARLFLGTGVMGGLTTYSAFSYETARMMQVEAWSTAAVYAVGMAAASVALCLLGIAAARALVR